MRYLYTDVKEVEQLMSEMAAQREPFLFAFNFELTEALFVPNPLNQSEILFDTPLGNNRGEPRPITEIKIEPKAPTFEQYKAKFDVVQRHLHRGDSFLVNLAMRTPIETQNTLRQIFDNTLALYSLYIPERMVCFSPERFVHISADGTISTNPMKGTIDATLPNAKGLIMSDEKESAEHATVVDLLRNDLSINAERVHVERYRYTTKIDADNGQILQVSSEIKGKLADDWRAHLGLIISEMLPAGSVSGAPKQSTAKIIGEAEGEPRGFYAGIFGYYNGNEMDSGVIIRYIEQARDGRKYFRSGGGITARSDARREFDEVLQKIYLPTALPRFSEVISIVDGEPQRLDLHQARADRTTKHFFGTRIDLKSSICIPKDARKGLIKCRIEYDREIQKIEFSPYAAKEIRTCAIVHDDNINYSYKSVDRSRLNALKMKANTDDIIIIKNGRVTDSSFCNLVFQDAEGQFFMPKDSLLQGTRVDALVKSNKVKIKTITEEMLSEFENVYFVNAMRGLDLAPIRVSEIIKNITKNE